MRDGDWYGLWGAQSGWLRLILLLCVPQVQLFSEVGFQGSVLALEDSVPSLQEGFSVASCKVLAGRYCSRRTKTKYQAVVIVMWTESLCTILQKHILGAGPLYFAIAKINENISWSYRLSLVCFDAAFILIPWSCYPQTWIILCNKYFA